MTAAAPSGVVTFLFTDVEGSTRQWERLPYDVWVATVVTTRQRNRSGVPAPLKRDKGVNATNHKPNRERCPKTHVHDVPRHRKGGAKGIRNPSR